MYQRFFKANWIAARQFNQYVSSALTFTGFVFINAVVTLGLLFDVIVFPRIREKQIKSPIVIVGNPRSGTTFLQRFMVDHEMGAGMRVWKMLYPSLTLQAAVKPLLPLLEKVSPARHHSNAAHETSLTSVETDDPSFMFRFFDGFFLYGFFYAWAKQDYLPNFLPENRDTSARDFKWLENMWKRNLISEKQDRVVAKLFSLSLRLPQFLKYFPDAKIIYMVRDPVQTVPSGLSLVTGVLDGRFGFWKLSQDKRQHYVERMYSALHQLSMRFLQDYQAGKIPHKNLYILTYPKLMNDFDNTMQEILDFIGDQDHPGQPYNASPEFLDEIKKIAEKQKRHKSEHKYDLERFGLTEERIRKDYAPIYAAFDVDARAAAKQKEEELEAV